MSITTRTTRPAPDRPQKRGLWQLYAAVFLTLTAVYFALPDGVYADVTYTVIGLSCVGAILAGVALHRPAFRMPWWFMAAGQASWVAGDSIFSVEQANSDLITFPAASDVAYLLSYPLLAVGVLGLIHAQHRTRDLAGLVDSLIITAGVALLSWAFIAGPILGDPTVSSLGKLIAAAYPAGDIILLALLMRLMTGQSSWTPSFRLLVGATVTLLAADTGFATSPGGSGYAAGLDLLWLASYVLWGAAALHPDMVNLTTASGHRSTTFTGQRLLILGGVVMLPVMLLLARDVLGLDVGVGTLMIGAAALSLLVMGRMACDIEEIRLTKRQCDDLQADLFRRATRDEVTGLANRLSLVGLTGLALERGLRDGTSSALIVLEVNGLTDVERQHGDLRTDVVLHKIARRLEDVVGRDDCVARIGPRQFGILIDQLGPHVDLPVSAKRLLAACRAPVTIDGQPASVSAGAGIAVSLDGGTDPEVLLGDATLAAAATRAGGDGGVQYFDASLREEVLHRNQVEAGLLEAVRTDQLEVYYQPVTDLRTDVVVGHEALVRWNRPRQGVVGPDSFIPIAEKSDLICEVDRWVLHHATCQMAAWARADPGRCDDLTIAVNVSGRTLVSEAIVDDVTEALRLSGLKPAQLILEVTETVLVDLPRATAQMSALRRVGVSISIDDFGTGYTSIGQLGRLPVDSIKVDRSLVTSRREGAHELLALIVQAGQASGLTVVAEGIEDDAQLATVKDLRYDFAQGYLIGTPRPASDTQAFGPLGLPSSAAAPSVS